MRAYPEHLQKMIQLLRKLPGVGSRSAERFAFHLLTWSPTQLNEIGDTLKGVQEHLKCCEECGCLRGSRTCFFCDTTKRDTKTMCVIATPRDAFSIEDTHEYRGLYHVLGGVLSPLENRGPEHLFLSNFKERIQKHNVQELVIALDSTLEGDATALFIKQELDALHVHISRLAFGIPMGSHLDYVDGGTLARAMSGRHQF